MSFYAPHLFFYFPLKPAKVARNAHKKLTLICLATVDPAVERMLQAGAHQKSIG